MRFYFCVHYDKVNAAEERKWADVPCLLRFRVRTKSVERQGGKHAVIARGKRSWKRIFGKKQIDINTSTLNVLCAPSFSKNTAGTFVPFAV